MADNSTTTAAEEWRDIQGWPGYQVSDHGRVRSFKKSPSGNLLSQQKDGCGYPQVTLQINAQHKRTWRVHRLVCEAFHGPKPSPRHLVAHNDGTRDNNRPENLRWATMKENIADCVAHGTQPFGERTNCAKITDAQWEELVAMRAAGATLRQLAARYGLDHSSISQRLRRHLSA